MYMVCLWVFSGARRLNGFSKQCWAAKSMCGPLRFCPWAYSKRRTHPSGGKLQTHTHSPLHWNKHTRSLYTTYSYSEVWELPIHCEPPEMLTSITSLAARAEGLAEDCPVSSHSQPHPRFFFLFSYTRWCSVNSAASLNETNNLLISQGHARASLFRL